MTEKCAAVLALRDHQQIGLDLLAENDRFALLWDMRTGKTLPALIDATDKLISGEAGSWLWIAPLPALGAVHHNALLLSKERQDAIRDKMTLINYDKLSRKGSKYQREIAEVDWDGITLDEGHKIKNPNSNVARFILGTPKQRYADGLCRRAKFRRFLTGTPVSNSHLENFWSMLSFFKDGYTDYNGWKSFYCIERPIPGTYARQIVGYRCAEHLLEEVSAVSNSVRLSDVTNAPDDNPDYVVHVPWSDKRNPDPFAVTTRKIYDEVLESYIDGLDMVMDNPMARMAKLRMIAAGAVTDDEGNYYPLASEKVPYTIDTIENFEGKVVVFHFFTESGNALCRELDKMGISHKTLNGRTPQAEKKTVWRDFQADPECKVFIAQINSGNAGIDLYTADMIIFMEPCLSSTDLEQARKRISDVNAEVAKSFVFMLTENSIEEKIYGRLCNHESFTDKLFVNLIADQAVAAGKITEEEKDEKLRERRFDL